MSQEKVQQDAQEQALVFLDDQVKIGLSNMRIDPIKKQIKSQFWFTVSMIKNSSLYQYQFDNKKFEIDVELIHKILCYMDSLELLSDISIPKRHSLHIHCIKDVGYLGKLKFISKEEPTQVYGMTIPDVMINDDIKKSKAYQTYLAISSGIVALKKAIKRMKATATPTKKGSITANENILSDPNKALHLELLNIKKRTQASRKAYILQQIPKGLSKGSCKKLEVPNEPKCSCAAQVNDDDYGSKGEVKILSSDDDRTESNTEKEKSEKAYDDEVKDNEKTHDDEEKHDDDEVANKEETGDERTESEKGDVEKIDVEKAKEEKDDKEQS
uniref:Uncharacterized protein n=1 Tax=Tanacetum cinerariifolium TaxID=118510 RepID=A0A6L2L4D1_TANCI|nr:hypothetical protein [Tanacetum cinerariifolium]